MIVALGLPLNVAAIILGCILSMLLSVFSALGPISIPTDALTEFFHADTVTSIHLLPVSWYFLSSSLHFHYSVPNFEFFTHTHTHTHTFIYIHIYIHPFKNVLMESVNSLQSARLMIGHSFKSKKNFLEHFKPSLNKSLSYSTHSHI